MSTRQPIDRENGLGSFCIKLQFVDLIQSSNTHNSPTPYCTYSFNVLDLVCTETILIFLPSSFVSSYLLCPKFLERVDFVKIVLF